MAHHSELQWWQWLLLPKRDLVRRFGVALSEADDLRERETGHRRAFSRRWIQTLGMWGCVADADAIGAAAGVDNEAVRSYANYNELFYCRSTEPVVLSQPLLASQIHGSYLAGLDTSDVAAAHGVFPVEARLYNDRFEQFATASICDMIVVATHEAAAETPEQIKARAMARQELAHLWQKAGLSVVVPEAAHYTG